MALSPTPPAYLVSDDEVDQIRACELGALPRLEALLKSSIINSPAHPTASDLETQATLREVSFCSYDRLQFLLLNFVDGPQSALLTTAALSLASEKNRKGLIDANLLGHIVAMLSDSESRVRAAACQCARALSRSGGALRTHLIEAGAARPLFTLLGWQQSDVIVCVSSSLSLSCVGWVTSYITLALYRITAAATVRPFRQLTPAHDADLKLCYIAR